MAHTKDCSLDRVAQAATLVKETRREVNPGIYTIEDAKGEIIVNTTEGTVARKLKSCKAIQYITGGLSRKKNGYVYLSIYYLDKHGHLRCYMLGQHTLILLVADLEGYHKDLVPCHKDECPWNNKASNLEWGTQSDNLKHYNFMLSLSDGRLETRCNLKYSFKCLKAPISIQEMKTWKEV